MQEQATCRQGLRKIRQKCIGHVQHSFILLFIEITVEYELVMSKNITFYYCFHKYHLSKAGSVG